MVKVSEDSMSYGKESTHDGIAKERKVEDDV